MCLGGELFLNPALILGVLKVPGKNDCCAGNDKNLSTIFRPTCSGDWKVRGDYSLH